MAIVSAFFTGVAVFIVVGAIVTAMKSGAKPQATMNK